MSVRTPGLGRVGVWAGDFDLLTAADVRQAAAAIEDLGYGTLWFPGTIGREAMTQAAVLLAATRRITVAAGMADIYGRDVRRPGGAARCGKWERPKGGMPGPLGWVVQPMETAIRAMAEPAKTMVLRM